MKKYHGHYCKVCGRYLPNEKFSGSGHANHICRVCKTLHMEKREERMTIRRLMDLPFHLSKKNRIWLETMRIDPRDKVREAAEWQYEMRFAHLEWEHEDDDIDIEDIDEEYLLYLDRLAAEEEEEQNDDLFFYDLPDEVEDGILPFP